MTGASVAAWDADDPFKSDSMNAQIKRDDMQPACWPMLGWCETGDKLSENNKKTETEALPPASSTLFATCIL